VIEIRLLFDNDYHNHYQTHCFCKKSPAVVGAKQRFVCGRYGLIKIISHLLIWKKITICRSAVFTRSLSSPAYA
ncbi:TPA: hypothetical protein ACOFK4_004622, partial [Klebsiella michiganensis]